MLRSVWAFVAISIVVSSLHICDAFRLSTPNVRSFPFDSLMKSAQSLDASQSLFHDAAKCFSRTTATALATLCSFGLIGALNTGPAVAIGDIYELKDRNMVLQGITFNVEDANKEEQYLDALFQKKCKAIRSSSTRDSDTIVMAFGADSYKSPEGFLPGVSDFQEDGGHATLTFKSKKETDASGAVEIAQRGNGLMYVKVGAETIRLSKAIQQGAEVQYAYGWVDLDSPAGVPYEVVVGLARDPVMLAAIRVTDVAESTKFFSSVLGMTPSSLPLARSAGSQYEQQQPAGSVYLSYGSDSLGLLLLPADTLTSAEAAAAAQSQSLFSRFTAGVGAGKKSNVATAIARRVEVGSMLDAFTVVVDDSQPQLLPPAVRDAIESSSGSAMLKSPDGYPIRLLSYSSFAKEATKSVPVP